MQREAALLRQQLTASAQPGASLCYQGYIPWYQVQRG